ncbi:MAG: sigma 54-interacting transcriptional regulator [Chloracidobacterium sp.]|nr:sigma 54-interacting transcriptional regulator [Chloracidobacterium sp.]
MQCGHCANRSRSSHRPTDAYLISGESGTGKELVARAIHAQSKRRNAALSRSTQRQFPKNWSSLSYSVTQKVHSPRDEG